jgi:hypothetical protein
MESARTVLIRHLCVCGSHVRFTPMVPVSDMMNWWMEYCFVLSTFPSTFPSSTFSSTFPSTFPSTSLSCGWSEFVGSCYTSANRCPCPRPKRVLSLTPADGCLCPRPKRVLSSSLSLSLSSSLFSSRRRRCNNPVLVHVFAMF